MRLAIVGSRQFDYDLRAKDEAAKYIQWVLEKYQPELVISGGAIGIDQLAATLAAFEDIKVVEFLPELERYSQPWQAYKARNIRIAKECTHLVAILHRKSKTNGGGWTARYAKNLGRKVAYKYYG